MLNLRLVESWLLKSLSSIKNNVFHYSLPSREGITQQIASSPLDVYTLFKKGNFWSINMCIYLVSVYQLLTWG